MNNKNQEYQEIVGQLSLYAEQLMREGKTDEAKEAYQGAAPIEEYVLRTFGEDKPRTMAILALSTAALYYKAEDFANAKRVAEEYLKKNIVCVEIRKELEEIARSS